MSESAEANLFEACMEELDRNYMIMRKDFTLPHTYIDKPKFIQLTNPLTLAQARRLVGRYQLCGKNAYIAHISDPFVEYKEP